MFFPISGTTAQAILVTVILLAVVVVGIRVAMFLRPKTTKDQTDNIGHTSASALTRNFEEMRNSNDISDAEFRTIKSVLEKKHADKNGHSVGPRNRNSDSLVGQ